MSSSSDTFKGAVLVASTSMDDPQFSQTVVLLLQHGEDGALGVVLNRPVGSEQLDKLAAAADLVGATAEQLNFHIGGPEAGPVIVLQTAENQPGTKQGKMFFISDKGHFSRLTRNFEDCRFFVGHATWEAGQLEDEVELGLWKVLPVSPDLLFGEYEQLWSNAMREFGRSFYREILNIQSFPEDAALN